MGNPVVHFQICAEDVDAMSAFYSELFGWRIAPRRLTSVEADVSGTYPSIEAEEGGISGGITDGVEGGHGSVLVIEVEDVEETLQQVEALGGRRRHPDTPPEAMALGANGEKAFELAEFEDPEGNLVQVIHR